MNLRFLSALGNSAKIPQNGRELWEVWGAGPTSYSQATGDAVIGPSQTEHMSAPGGAVLTLSGNYEVIFQPQATNTLRPGWIARWRYAAGSSSPSNPANFAPAGVALGLGPLSAAATQSTFTTAGLLTVVGANTLSAGQFIVLSNGASAAGICLDGMIVQVASATATGYTANVGQPSALHYTIATDTLKYQVVQVGAGNLLQASPLAAPITGVLATANLLTITQANSLTVGQFVYLNGPFKTASVFALGAIVQVASASSTGWTANWQGTIIAQTSAETAVASLLVTNGNAPVAFSGAVSITNSVAVANDATHAGLLTLTAAQAYVPGNIVVAQGLSVNTLIDGSIGPIIATSLTNALFKVNTNSAAASTSAETTGVTSLLVTGAPSVTSTEVANGTNLSAESVQFLAVGGDY